MKRFLLNALAVASWILLVVSFSGLIVLALSPTLSATIAIASFLALLCAIVLCFIHARCKYG